ncbi:DUF7527 domain-containing protein [Halomontanus rarus]|uniref:DUF7527 domain-containing protein n=1 Tax=Halomontanus rarus TaxID=3034020 RepID=UPI001A99F371
MDPRTTERVERWDSRPFADGYDGLSDLADREFSGAVTAAGTWLFMLNGRIVGIVDGTIEDFDGATGTTYEAPDPALPLLCSMEETGGETRAKYYTNETPLEEVDNTLSSGSFTGYVELSEGVLSGDYYAVYYGGRRMAAAYIGNAQRLLTGEEAFERAADEVGIYEVVDVDVDVTDVPGGEDPSPTETAPANGETGLETADGEPTATDAETDEATDSGATTPSPASRSSPSTSITDTDTTAETGSVAEAEGTTDDVTTGSERTVESSSPSTSATTDDEAVDQRFGIDLESRSDTGAEPEPEPESELESDPASNPDSTLEETPDGITTADGESAESAPPGITDDLSEPLVDEATDTSTNETDVSESEPDGPSDDEGTTASARAADENVDSTPVDEAETDRSPSSSTSTSTSSSPNPDDLEAAAEELSESGVPWSSDSGVDANSNANSNSNSDSSPSSETNTGPGTPTAEEIDLTVDEIANADESTAELEERFKQEEQWRETRSIPSIDPDKTAESAAPQSNRRGAKKRTRKQQKRTQRRSRGRSSTDTGQSPDRDSESGPSAESRAESGSGSDSRTSAGSETSSPTRTDAERTDRTAQSQSSPGGRPDTGQQSQPDAATRQSSRSRSGAGARSPADSDALESDMLEREDKIDRLTQQVDDLEQRRDELETKAADLEHERDRLESENQELTETVERLESRIEELETELERVRSADATGAVAEATDARGTELSPQQALAGTNLFVRYGSKSQPTLEAAHDGDVDAASVNSNLLLEHHTQFDETDVSVDGVPYEEFLASTMEYQFVDWLTGTLLYEIRDTGHATSLGDLYDVIPRIDRAELHASISLEDDDTDEVPDQVTFDVVAFDKRGTPLVAANLNDSRDPATREMLIELEETASAVNANFPDLGAAIVVTSSFFDPGALEIAEQATSGGFLSRGSKLSYVNLSRKQGYHMCLVESRSGGFHMNVPEL